MTFGALVVSLYLTSSVVFSYECDKMAMLCETKLEIRQSVTMMHRVHKQVYPMNGKLYRYDVTNTSDATPVPESQVIVADGSEKQRLVVVANMSMPGPDIVVYEGQRLIVHVENHLFTEGVSIHWHGLPLNGFPYMDGTAFLTQCPIDPGSSFTYDFIARPSGTYWYHSHIGSQRGKGLFGALIIKKNETNSINEHIIQVQEWNHEYDTDMELQYLIAESIVKDRKKQYEEQLLDGSIFAFSDVHSVLINGKGRYKSKETNMYNGSPLEVFNVVHGNQILFRVIGVGSQYPFRMSVDNHTITVIASDGHDTSRMEVESFIIYPGERFDIIINATEAISNYWIRAETLEVNKDIVGWAILRYDGATMTDPDSTSTKQSCTITNKCIVLNCPFSHYPEEQYTTCKSLNEMKSSSHSHAPEFVQGQSKEFFFNFGYNGIIDTINGKSFVFPPVSAISQPDQIQPSCDNPECSTFCFCTHTIPLNHDDTVQIVMTSNVGFSPDFGHPIHLHGHSFHVLKVGYGKYNDTKGTYITNSDDVSCDNDQNRVQENVFCVKPKWSNSSWGGDNIPGLELHNAPLKDTVMVPRGGYVVIRFKADNPGLWMLHCHIALHVMAGMSLVFNESFPNLPPVPDGFPKCNRYPPVRPAHVQSTQRAPTTTVLPTTAKQNRKILIFNSKSCLKQYLFIIITYFKVTTKLIISRIT
ncbi:hypothetical protein FSP39_016527 [Pinctada imbricata]|uniref:Uncharacterized protein n=1 Tax=Pinctada imbricata TaxID=66713 RepID=A0AA89C6Q4_PINIB|nr:hypothetical protein FSP39_016527 [Pinctada imbricata]